MFVEARRTGEELQLALAGPWRAAQYADIEAQLHALDLAGVRRATVEAGGVQWDLSGAWLLRGFLQRVRAAGIDARFAAAPPPLLALIDRTLSGEPTPATPAAPASLEPEWYDPAPALEELGRHAVHGWLGILRGLGFLGRISASFAGLFRGRRQLRPISIARHVYDTGITAVPIVALIAFLISVILAYMGAQELRQFGATIFVADLVTIGVLRELGVLLTAIIVAGRSGSAFAAELGSMRLSEEIDALHAIGVDPYEVLVLPRLIGLLIALPLLTIVADVIGLTGGALLCRELLGMPLVQFLERARHAIAPTTFWVGMIKAPVFACLIGAAGCYCGMRVRGSARELGRLTTLAVVEAIFFVILADALFAVLFQQFNI